MIGGDHRETVWSTGEEDFSKSLLCTGTYYASGQWRCSKTGKLDGHGQQ